ncbi:MAG: hypothetical protein HY268_30420 [Deltaproteobacteria bacterium]|nr:hypothetical protein [Deltaproteobacteria bacterium]
MNEKTFIRWLGSEDRSRQVVVLDEGKIVRFVVQYETFLAGKWVPVVRYDTAHGFAHKDILSPSGETEKKVTVPYSYNEALTNAEVDVKLNWHRYREEFLQKVKG